MLAEFFFLGQNPLLLNHHLVFRVVAEHVSALLHPFKFALGHIIDIVDVHVSSLTFSVLPQNYTLVYLANGQSVICICVVHKLLKHVFVIPANLFLVIVDNEAFQIFIQPVFLLFSIVTVDVFCAVVVIFVIRAKLSFHFKELPDLSRSFLLFCLFSGVLSDIPSFPAGDDFRRIL